MKAQSPAIVIGVDSMQGIQTVRLLARRGIPVIGMTRSRRHPCARTRFCTRLIETDTQGDAFVEGRSYTLLGVDLFAEQGLREYEFNSEITTGISAPPIGITNSTPRSKLAPPRIRHIKLC